MQTLWMQQLDVSGKFTHELCRLSVNDETWDRVTKRVLPSHLQQEPLDCWIELMSETGDDLISEEPFIVRSHQMHWLLKDFFKLPASVYEKVKLL